MSIKILQVFKNAFVVSRLESGLNLVGQIGSGVWVSGSWHRPPQSTCSFASMHFTHGHYARSRRYRVLAMCQMRKSEEPLVVHRFLTWSNRHLRLFGHITRSSPREDHHRALAACIRQVLPDWKRPAGRPSHTWLCAVEADLGPLNFGLATAWRKATHYSRQVATYCGHSNAAVAYALKKRRRKK